MSGLRFDIEIPTCREGVFVPCGFAEPDDVIECVKLAERLGYDAVWATDFLTPTPESGIGATESVAAKIGAVAEQGIDHFNVLHIVGDTLEARFEQMQMFMEDVVPRLG